jgi:hypothetical protein
MTSIVSSVIDLTNSTLWILNDSKKNELVEPIVIGDVWPIIDLDQVYRDLPVQTAVIIGCRSGADAKAASTWSQA